MTIWFDKCMQWFAAASGKRGRSPKFSDAAIQFYLPLKNMFGLTMRQLPKDEVLDSLTDDGAYETQPVHEAVTRCGATPVIPPRKNARIRKSSVSEHRNAAIAACKRLGLSIWKRWSGYHRRSSVETKMNCIKRLGERVMSRTFERQVNELHIRATILNRFTELGRPQTAAVQ
ncbi:hypothetical protein O987_08070 [Comamonas testosteroni TK102]|uniref:Transposase IS4-like domain-containing protein n=1 Tax=Comamonas testosteroni TK102 TaxID=1392005 RepID=A0A076PM59_COMTE|nr:hypothetical protein O987_08070 [Comamonas testosteroni TK102]